MMNQPIDTIVDWLRDAHAMEQQSEKMAQGFSDRLKHYPQLKVRLEQHIEETHGQKELLKGCLDRLGANPSIIKDLTGKIIAFGQSVSGIPVDDEVIKGAMSCYVFEHMEIASYKILISAAKAVGDVETQRVCELILAQEVAMAEWLGNNLEELTFNYLSRAGDTMKEAKR